MVWLGLILGIFACSTSVIFIKSTEVNPAYLGALRLFIGAILLSPVFIRELRRHRDLDLRDMMKTSLPAGVFLALHFITWNEGARRTLAAHATLIVNMVPLALPMLLWITHRERVNRGEVAATVLSMLGIAWLGVHDYRFSKDYWVGDLVCFASMVLFACYLALGRRNRGVRSIFLYVVPVYLIAGSVCLAVSLFDWESVRHTRPWDYGMAFCLALVPTVVGHTLLNFSMRHLRGQVVGIMNVGQFVFAGILAYFLYQEAPEPTFFWVCVCVIASCALVILSHRKDHLQFRGARPKPPPPPAPEA